ncbi:MAG: helix-turn-helix domain-containing protein [Candidatus Margulisbacteria bacterium]|nr:helix-turn-helix domain-containing protein [Candidatus Margulisiibacteriota bacterium]
MAKKEFMSIPELAKLLGISRIAAYKKVKKGEIKAKKIGRSYAIPFSLILGIQGKSLAETDRKQIDAAVKKTVNEYGEVLKLLGKE